MATTAGAGQAPLQRHGAAGNPGGQQVPTVRRLSAAADETSDLKWALKALNERAEDYQLFNAYYYGNHRLLFATEKFRNAFGNLFMSFADNLCPAVVNSIADRLHIDGFDGKQAKAGAKLWEQLRLDRVAGQVHQESLRCGDSYLIVWPDKNGDPCLWPQEADKCAVQYDDEEMESIKRGCKAWVNNEMHGRLNIYLEDRIMRYVTVRKINDGSLPDAEGDGWAPFNGDGKRGTLTNNYGVVPMFHFANDAGVAEFGRSELADVVPLQDALNKAICDMLVAMEFVAFPQRYATGLQLEIDPSTGKPRNPPFTPGVDRMLTAPGEGVKFGQFPAAELKGYIDAQDSLRLEISRVSGTPAHFLGVQSQVPSGEALKVIEGRLVKKIEDRQASWGHIWGEAVRLALRIDGKSSKPDLQPLWKTAAPHNPLLDAEVVLVKSQIGISQHQGLRELGYTDEQIDQMIDERLDEAELDLELTNAQGQVTSAGILDATTGGGGLTPQGEPGAPGTSGAPKTTEGGKVPARGGKGRGGRKLPGGKPGPPLVLPPKPRVTTGKGWQD